MGGVFSSCVVTPLVMIRNGRLAVAVVVGLVLVAGCGSSGTTTTDGGDGGVEVTVAPGVGGDAGLVNRSALLASHRQSLNESGFTYRFDSRRIERVEFPNESARESIASSISGRVAAGPGLSPYLDNRTDRTTDPATTTVLYVDDDGAAERIVRGDDATVEESFREVTILATTYYLMGNFLENGDWTVTERRDDAVVLEAGPGWSDWDTETDRYTNVTERRFFEGEMVVSSEGHIERMTVNQTVVEIVRWDGELESRGTTIRQFEYELLETDGTDVERPAWVDEVGNETTTTSESLPEGLAD